MKYVDYRLQKHKTLFEELVTYEELHERLAKHKKLGKTGQLRI